MTDKTLSHVLLVVPAALGLGVVVWLSYGYPGNRAPPAPREEDGRATGKPRAPARSTRRGAGGLTAADRAAIRRLLGESPVELARTGYPGLALPAAGSWRDGPGRGERHQDIDSYIRSRPVGPTARRRVLVLRQVGTCDKRLRRVTHKIAPFLSAFFQAKVVWGTPLDFPTKGRVRGIHPYHYRQYLVRPILKEMQKRVPPQAIAVLGVACEDLYPAPAWNFVFGYALLHDRVGVYSLVRFFPWVGSRGKWYPEEVSLGLLRTLKLVAHETGHMYGLDHCVSYSCVMNGSNGLDDTDEQPLHLCPSCLAKLHWNVRFDVRSRYAGVSRALKQLGLATQAKWYDWQFERLGVAAFLERFGR